MHYYTLVTITMVTGFLPSLLRLMEHLGAHWSVTKDRDDDFTMSTGMLNFCCTHYLWLCSMSVQKKTPNFLEFFFLIDAKPLEVYGVKIYTVTIIPAILC